MAAAILTIVYGGELLYLWIWCNHLAWSAHIIVTPWFTARQPICVHDLSPHGKGSSRSMKLLGGLNYEKIRRYNNSPPYMTARWPPQQFPPLNFLGFTSNSPHHPDFVNLYQHGDREIQNSLNWGFHIHRWQSDGKGWKLRLLIPSYVTSKLTFLLRIQAIIFFSNKDGAKLLLSLTSAIFDILHVFQKYFFYENVIKYTSLSLTLAPET